MLTGFPGIASGQQPVVVFPPVEGADVEIDGSWTTAGEWSKASETIVNYTDGSRLAIRGMNDGDFLFVMLEMPDDYLLDGHGAVCFDTEAEGGTYLAQDDYCFVMGTALREYHGTNRTTLMQQVPLDQYVTAQRAMSDSKSPLYSSKEHVSYEFRVPLSYLGDDRTHYGFYVTFDTTGQDNNYTYYYSWPDYKTAEYLRTVPPRSWGIVSLSEDTVIPEFPVPVIGALAAVVGGVALMSRTRLFRL